jgi:hypothetical protein
MTIARPRRYWGNFNTKDYTPSCCPKQRSLHSVRSEMFIAVHANRPTFLRSEDRTGRLRLVLQASLRSSNGEQVFCCCEPMNISLLTGRRRWRREAPQCNSPDGEVGVSRTPHTNEARRADTNLCRSFGPRNHFQHPDHDLTVMTITCRPLGPSPR